MKYLSYSILFFSSLMTIAQDDTTPRYICPPCPVDCHNETYDKPGNCPVCNMELLNANNINEGLNYTHIYPKDVCDIVSKNPEVLLLDVRTVGEFTGETSNLGKLRNAINIPIQELADRIAELDAYKENEIIVYCSVSMRSPRASKLLSDNGFGNIKNMLGGMTTWNSAAVEEVTCKNDLLVK